MKAQPLQRMKTMQGWSSWKGRRMDLDRNNRRVKPDQGLSLQDKLRVRAFFGQQNFTGNVLIKQYASQGEGEGKWGKEIKLPVLIGGRWTLPRTSWHP